MPKRLIVIGTLLLLLTVTLGLTRNPGAAQPQQSSAASSTSSSTASSSTVPSAQTTGPTEHISASTRSIGGSLAWQITSSSTAQRIDNDYLAPLVAHGTFLILQVVASNGSAHAVDLDSDTLALTLDGSRYSLDQAALASLELDGRSALTPVELQPGATASGWVVFDVSSSVVAATPQLCVESGAQAAAACG